MDKPFLIIDKKSGKIEKRMTENEANILIYSCWLGASALMLFIFYLAVKYIKCNGGG